MNFPQNPSEVLSRIDSKRRPRPPMDVGFQHPRDTLEAILAEIWAEVLGIRDIGVNDNFFSLGGDSLHMTQVASRLRDRCSVEISFVEFFENPTIGTLAGLIRSGTLSCVKDEEEIKTEPIVSAITIADPEQDVGPSIFISGADLLNKKLLSIRNIVIPTNTRPNALRRCLWGLLHNLNYYGHSPRIVIADGTSIETELSSNRNIVKEVSKAWAGDILLTGRQEKREMLNRFLAAGLEKEILDFGLEGLGELGLSTLGANRNVLLLSTAGDAFLSVDDDIEFRFAYSPRFNQGKEFWSGRSLFEDDATELDFYQNRESLESSVKLSDIDFVGAHEGLLGRNIETLGFSHMAGEHGEKVSDSCSGKVLITLNGTVGDCCWGTPSEYLFIDGVSFKRLISSERGYLKATTSRNVFRAAPSLRVANCAGSLIGAAFGADGRSTLPPFVPVGRGSDVIFGQLMERLHPFQWFGHFPWAILHTPIESRQFWPGEILRSAATTDVKGMFCGLLSSLPSNKDLTADCIIRNTGRALIEIGNQPLPEFRATLRECKNRSARKEILALETRLDQDYSSVPSCARDIRNYIRLLRQGQEHPTAGIPAEIIFRFNEERAVHWAQRIVFLYGRLLYAWPEIIQVALTLRNEGLV